MLNRLQAAFKAFQSPTLLKAQPTKSYSYNMFDLIGGGGVRDNQLIATTWGATLAYYKVPAIKSSVDFIAENASIVPIVERDVKGNEIARSDKNPEKSRMIMAILDAYKYHGVPFIQEWVSSRLLYGQTFIRLVPNRSGYINGLRWLNPNAITIHAPRSEIVGYHYGAFDDETPPNLRPDEILFARGFNPGDDIYGYSPTLNVMGKVNITLDFDRFVIAYYKNGGQLGMAVSFKEAVDIGKAKELAEFWRREFRGVDNFFKTHISHIPLDYRQFDPLDITKPLEVSKDAERGVYKGFRIAPELLGDTENNPYQFSDETKNAAMQTVVKPNLDAIANALNNKAMPYFADEGHTVGFDLSQWQTVSADVIAQDVNASLVPISEGATKRGYKPDPRLKDIYMVNNRPMHVDVIVQVSNEIPPEYQTPKPQQMEIVSSINPDNPPTALLDTQASVTDVTPNEPDFGKSINIGDDHHAHLEAFEPKHDNYDDEFQAWKRFAFKGKSNRQFEPYWLRGDIGDALQESILLAVGDKELIAKAFSTAQEAIDSTFKALSATKIDFEEDFNSLIKKAMADNNFGRVQWSSAMRAIIRRYGRQAYADGLIEGGVLDGELSEEDQNEVASLIASQSAYVTNLGAALYKDGTVSEQMALQKPEMWFNRSLKPFYEAGLLSADGNGVYEFAGRDGRESCTTCMHLKGQRHRLKTWARRGLRPGTDADNFECGGWHCEHVLIKVFARERGNWLG